jgi:4-hydroxy-4-methyl-2-oxoglutarate aldolase
VIVADDDGVLCVPIERAESARVAADVRVEREAASRAAYRDGELSLDRNDLRAVLAELGVVYRTQAEHHDGGD